MNQFVIDNEVEINASAAEVWKVITDFDRYPEWNPFVVAAQSSLKPGDPIDMKVKLLGPVQRQVEIILEVNEGKGFSYQMKPFPWGALSSRRSHEIIELDAQRCRYKSHFQLQGWMMPLVRGLMKGPLQRGFSGMTDAIRQRAEVAFAQTA